jgi:hypothetical protein
VFKPGWSIMVKKKCLVTSSEDDEDTSNQQNEIFKMMEAQSWQCFIKSM